MVSVVYFSTLTPCHCISSLNEIELQIDIQTQMVWSARRAPPVWRPAKPGSPYPVAPLKVTAGTHVLTLIPSGIAWYLLFIPDPTKAVSVIVAQLDLESDIRHDRSWCCGDALSSSMRWTVIHSRWAHRCICMCWQLYPPLSSCWMPRDLQKFLHPATTHSMFISCCDLIDVHLD